MFLVFFRQIYFELSLSLDSIEKLRSDLNIEQLNLGMVKLIGFNSFPCKNKCVISCFLAKV